MRVFVAGATGAIGRPLVRLLLDAGHEVTGMTRSEERAQRLRDAGATPAVADAFDRERVLEVVASARPDVVVHQLTDLPQSGDPAEMKAAQERTNRVRREGTANLLDAARGAGARRLVAQSISFLYAPADGPADEDAAPWLQAPEPFAESVRTMLDVERSVVEAEGIEGIVLRYGFFYGPDTYYAPDGGTARQVLARRFPVVGRGSGVFSFVHVDDAAAATVAALDRGAPGVYNVVDDEPAAMREWLPVYADALGAKRPLRVPAFVARMVAGQVAVAMATRSRGASNAKARRELGWTPQRGSWRQGFAEEL